MGAIIQGGLLPRSVDLDRVGFPVGHVAVYAGCHHATGDFVSHRMLARLMTRQTLLRELGDVSFRSMDVVASRTGHVSARAKALAAPQQPHLITMHVRNGNIGVGSSDEIVVEPLTRPVCERRSSRLPLPGMAQRAIFHPSVPRDARGIEDGCSAR